MKDEEFLKALAEAIATAGITEKPIRDLTLGDVVAVLEQIDRQSREREAWKAKRRRSDPLSQGL